MESKSNERREFNVDKPNLLARLTCPLPTQIIPARRGQKRSGEKVRTGSKLTNLQRLSADYGVKSIDSIVC